VNSVRVLHVLPSLHEKSGGPLRLVLDLSARAEALGLHSEVLGLGDQVLHDNPLHASKVHALPFGILGGIYGHSPQLRAWLAANLPRFDGVVVHGAWTYHGWAVSRECERAGIPYAYFPHGMLEKWAVHGQGRIKSLKKLLYWQLLESRICRRACCTFFTTALERDFSSTAVDQSRRTLILRPYGIDPAVPAVTAAADAALLQPDDKNVALFLGRLHPKKNVALLIEAWHRARVPGSWRLVIAGDGDEGYRRKLQSLVQTYELAAQIQFAGFVHGADKAYLLQRAAWFLLPSSQENFGVAVLEAVQHGCAVAISEGVYLSESFRVDSEVLPVTTEAWTDFLGSRMQDFASRQRTRDLDREHLMKTFGMDQVVGSWVEAQMQLFSSRTNSAARLKTA
jgi:glycosyltransferase involved in cell wall biosynthesis